MKVSLSRTARIWVLTLLLGGVSLLMVIAWTAIGHKQPKPRNSQPPEISDSFAETITPPVMPAGLPAQPTRGKPDVGRSPVFQAPTKPAQAEPQTTAPPSTDFAAKSDFARKSGVLKGLRNLVGIVGPSKDAQQTSTK